MKAKLRPRYRLVPHEWTSGHDIQVTITLSGADMLSLLGTVNCGLASLETCGDSTADDQAEFRAERLEVIALMKEIQERREAAAKVLREES